MSTRATIIIQDEHEKILFYRHSDGYPEHTFQELKDFVKDYTNGYMRLNAPQSAGWLIVRGYQEYLESSPTSPSFRATDNKYSGWKVGAYEPATDIYGGVEFVYTIDLKKRTLSWKAILSEEEGETVKF